jgi:hypothetical protein
MDVDAATGALSWTPTTKTRGPTRVTLLAQNEAGVAEQDFVVDVDCAKSACGCDAGAGSLVLLAAVLAVRRRRR